MRYFLIAFAHHDGGGSVWFEYNGHPSANWIKKQIKDKFRIEQTVAITNIHEFSEEDYRSFDHE